MASGLFLYVKNKSVCIYIVSLVIIEDLYLNRFDLITEWDYL